MELQPDAKPEPDQKLTLWQLWPLPVAVFYITTFNVTYLMGWMKWLGVPDSLYYPVSWVASESEMLWWFFFFGWSGRSVAKAVVKSDYVKRKIQEFQLKGYPQEINSLVDLAKPTVQAIWAWCSDELDDLVNPPEGFRRRFFRGTLAFLRVTWYPVAFFLIFLLGAVPHANIFPGIPLCRGLAALGRPGALLALMAGNTFTIYTNDKVVDLVFWLWAVLPVWGKVLLGLALVVFFVIRHRRRKARNQKAVSP